MVNRNLRILLLSTALLATPLWKVKAFTWEPVGDSVSADGFALTGGVYQEGDRIINTTQATSGEGGVEKSLRSFRRMGRKTRSGFRVPNFPRGETPPVANNTQFEATPADNTLNVSGRLNADPTGHLCPLKIDGDITLTARLADMVVNINTETHFVPYVDPTGDTFGQGGSFTGTGFAQIYFDVDAGKTITVNVDNNLEFKGRTLGAARSRGMKSDGTLVLSADAVSKGGEVSETTGPVAPIDMILTFAGKGQTIFKMADGTSIKFSGDIDGTHSVDVLAGNTFTGFSNNAAGTKVFITMENTEKEVNNGLNKVTFQRKELGNIPTGGVNPGSELRDLILVGNNSIITFLATDETGVAQLTNPTVGNFASIAFDPSNVGNGRMVLFVLGAYSFGFEEGFVEGDPEYQEIVRKFPFNEGAVVVAGHHVAGYTPEQIRTTLNYSVPAGGTASFRVVDNLFYEKRDPAVPYAPNRAQRDGLLVINDNQSVSKRAADPYLDFFHIPAGSGSSEEHFRSAKFNKVLKHVMAKRSQGGSVTRGETPPAEIFGHFWSYSFGVGRPTHPRNVRNGFILGINGVLDVYDNTFLDYVAGSVNQTDLLAENDYSGFKDAQGIARDSLSIIKKKNPAAFIVDGLDTALFSQKISKYEAADAHAHDKPVRATLNLYGDGAALFRASGSSKANYGYIYNFWRSLANVSTGGSGEESVGQQGKSPLDDAQLNFDDALLVGEGEYDGYSLAANADTVQKGEGSHVVEVEGEWSVIGLANNAVVDPATGNARNYATVVNGEGHIEMPTIEVGGKGEEKETRPLTVFQSYQRYNSPTLFFNNNAAFLNMVIKHGDLTKFVDGVPSTSEPAVTGGERLAFAQALFTFDNTDRDRYRFPEIRLYNATLDLEESLNASGVRFVVKDTPGLLVADASGPGGNNQSFIQFDDHGDKLDSDFRGFGRVFMLGSFNNTMADGTTNWVTEGAYFNVFKHNQLPATGAAATIELVLRNGDQFPADVNAADYNKQRAHHLFLMSGMDKGAANMALGWYAINGNTQSFPYQNTRYTNDKLVEVPSTNAADLFTVDAVKTPAATLRINGQFVNFGGFDKNGVSVKGPITRTDNTGAVYVNHGGKLTVGENNGLPFITVVDTTIAQKLWNDYNDNGDIRVLQLTGIVDLPHDQSVFMPGAAVQVYGLTTDMFSARASDTSGYVRVSFDNTDRTSKYDRSGAGDVEISWFDRDGKNTVFSRPAAEVVRSNLKKVAPRAQLRATESITAPIAKPDLLLYIGSNDDINQLGVAGATLSDLFMLDVSGDSTSPTFGRVREFVTVHRDVDSPTDHMPGEGAHARLFGEFGGRIGLGTRNYNANSVNAWPKLGKEAVTVVPLGDMTVDMNSNLIIADKQALVAGDLFGAAAAHRLTFFAEDNQEIRVPAGGELDLSSFGQAANLQQIAFAGNAKLVIENGATIRFPNNPTGGVVLYFTDDSQLIFEGSIQPQTFTTPFKNSAEANVERIKIVGQGQIWGNKQGTINVNGSVLVGVQADTQTPTTNLTISLQRNSQFNIGTSVLSGGAFEVGNPAPVAGTNINFTLTNFSGNPTFHLDREGFFGLGAGVINNQSNINGGALRAQNPVIVGGVASLDANGFPIFNPTTSNLAGWQIQPLNNVNSISIVLNEGSFEHYNIVDGSDSNAALIAVGPSANYNFSLSGPGDVAVRGGGNMMNVPATFPLLGQTFFQANVWDFASPNADGTQYSILPSGPLMLDQGGNLGGTAFGNGGFSFAATTQAAFFSVLSPVATSAQTTPKADIGQGSAGSGSLVAGFVNTNVNAGDIYPAADLKIVRLSGPGITPPGLASQGLATGALIARGDGAIDPTEFTPIQ